MEEVRIGRYTIVRPLGSGAFSTVYLARMEGEGPFVRQVAMKRLHKEATRDPAVVRLLIREAEIGGLMNHDNVVATIDLLKVRDEYFLITEYVDGLDLGDLYFHLTDLGETISPGLVAELGHQICLGLGYLHRLHDLEDQRLHLVHRDLKPSNVLVHRSGRVKITDFGVVSAKAREQITTRDTIIGTPRYMSPEQAVAAEVSPASDLYSLGVMMLQGLTSIMPVKLPYRRGMPVEELAPAPETVLADLPEDAEEFRPLLTRLLQPHAKDRPGSAEEVAEELAKLRAVYPLEQRLSSMVEHWIERIAEDTAEDGLEELPSDRTGEFSILGGHSWLGEPEPVSGAPVDDTESRGYTGARKHPDWEEPTERDGPSDKPPTAEHGTPRGEPTVKDDTPPIQPPKEEETDSDTPAPVPPPRAARKTDDPSIQPWEKPRRAPWLILALVLLLFLLGGGLIAGWHLLFGHVGDDLADGGGEATSSPTGDDPATHVPNQDALSEIEILDDEPGSADEPELPQPEEQQEPPEEPREPPLEVQEAKPREAPTPPPREEVPPRQQDEDALASVDDADEPVGEADEDTPLTLSVTGHRRTLRNTTLTTGIDTGATGCNVAVNWTVEGSGAWTTATLPGDGPRYTWSLLVTAEHRPAILYFVDVSVCGSAQHGSPASPLRIVVR